jgi:hypothetical protein
MQYNRCRIVGAAGAGATVAAWPVGSCGRAERPAHRVRQDRHRLSAVQRANTALRTALAQKDVVEGLAVIGLEATSSTPAELLRRATIAGGRW